MKRDDCEHEYIGQDESVPYCGKCGVARLQRREIRDNRQAFEKALLETHPGTPLGMTNGIYNENCIEGAWRGWNLRKPEPVSVLDIQQKTDIALGQYIRGEIPLEDYLAAVLDAAGVPYVD